MLGGRVHLTTGPPTQAGESTVIRRGRPALRTSESKLESREPSANDEGRGSAYSGRGRRVGGREEKRERGREEKRRAERKVREEKEEKKIKSMEKRK